ncbi:hypothetical protein Syun_013510 [Stephania yunnanensis]|uniref:RCK N-terminal domain-containing protein n=1 Tax=Stephania yunnanensis TaxID=152371 RepID=A0AAP0JIB7_9MAGN
MLERAINGAHNLKDCAVIYKIGPLRVYPHCSSMLRHNLCLPFSHRQKVGSLSYTPNHSKNSGLRGADLLTSSVFSWLRRRNSKRARRARFQMCAALDVAGAVDVINDLGSDTLTFLVVTVLVVPAFKMLKASPLFEMGLELSLARLKALAKFAFGMGLTQVVLSTLAFTSFELPPNGATGTKILEFLFHSRPDLVNIRTIDEAVVIGAALSLSSSAFVLQLLAEKGELPTRFGSATLGILLLQDIAVVPLLVILPVLESQNLGVESIESIWPTLASESLKALLGLGLLSLGGKFLLRRVFEVIAETRSSEAFVALCLLTVSGTSLLTQKLGFSDTLGAFLAGAILAETNFRTQIEADIRPFRGLLLGLFFVTTGSSIDMQVLGKSHGNTILPSVLGVLPLELNKLLIIVVVLSMALTPLLNEIGKKAAEAFDAKLDEKDVLANFLSTPLVVGTDSGLVGWPYVAFDLNPGVVKAARKMGFPIMYGDGSRPAVLQSAGVSSPKAVMVMYTGKQRTVEAVQRLRLAFPGIPIYARARDLVHLLDLKKAGATEAILENTETSLQLGSKLLTGLGVMSDDVSFLRQVVRKSMELQAQEDITKADERDHGVMKPLQVRVGDLLDTPKDNSPNALETESEKSEESDVLRASTFDPNQDSDVQARMDFSQVSSSLEQFEDAEDGKGVLHCELD